MKRGWLRLLGLALVLSGAACGSNDSVSGPSDPDPSTLSQKETQGGGGRSDHRDNESPRKGRTI